MFLVLTGRRATSAALLSLLGLVLATPLACGSSREEPPEETGLVGQDAGTPDAPACGFRCSRDLKKVLKGCDGQSETVVAECSVDEGCGIDKCVSACDAAALSKGSIGCGFWTLPPDDKEYGAGTCFVAMVANTWDRPVAIAAEWGADTLDISNSTFTASRASGEPVYTKLDGPLPPGEVALVFLSESKALVSDPEAIRCPRTVKAAVDVDPIKHGTARTKAFHIRTDAPVAAYSIFPYGGAEGQFPSATLLLPESSWDTTYVGVTVGMASDPNDDTDARRTMQIVAAADDTEVFMRPTFDIGRGDDIEPAVAGEVTMWTLQRGQVLQFTQRGLVSGSPIQANKPVGLFGGAPCAFIPRGIGFCDLFQQQIAPFSQWGAEYALVPFRPRVEPVSGPPRELVAWSFVGGVDGTELTWSPSKPAGAPDRLSAGQVSTFMTDIIATVKSQDKKHPFHAAVYMTGSSFGSGSGGHTLGDPDFVNMVPSDQFLDRYVFFTDYTFPETSLTIVRRKSFGGFKPVSLECGGEIRDWTPIGDGGEYDYAWVTLTSGYLPQKFPQGECGYGRHVVQSDGPFSVHVWGTAIDASYGYAGGMGARPVNETRQTPLIR
jgi:IgGFc binding protein